MSEDQLTPRDLQKECIALRRSVRRYIPLISKKTDHSIGMIIHCLDGHSSNIKVMTDILSAARAIQDNPPTVSKPKKARSASTLPVHTGKSFLI